MERIFIPGSRWLFFKLYTGTQSADILLTRHIGPFVRRLRENGAIDDFFFIRYTDPLFHLRLRLHLPDTSRYGEVFGAFYETFQPCVESRLVTTGGRTLRRGGDRAYRTAVRMRQCLYYPHTRIASAAGTVRHLSVRRNSLAAGFVAQ